MSCHRLKAWERSSAIEAAPLDTICQPRASLHGYPPFSSRFANSRVWFIQTSVDALILPTDSVGRTTLSGNVAAWYHIIRNSAQCVEKNGNVLASARLRWSIWPWQQNGSRIHVNDNTAISPQLLQMVRDEPHRVCAFANFRPNGKRQLDATVELGIVVPPDRFTRYESLVQFAMTLPSGTITLTLPDPMVFDEMKDDTHSATLIEPGHSCLIEGIELVVSRAKPAKFSRRDLQVDRRAAPVAQVVANALNDPGDEWYLFRRDETLAELTDAERTG